jgi:hypothetical protein
LLTAYVTMAEQSQTLGAEGYGEVLEGTEGRMQESAQKRAELRDQSRELAGPWRAAPLRATSLT